MRCVTNVSVSWTTSRIFASPRKFHDKICALEASAKAGCLLGGLILCCYMKRDLQRVRAERKEDSVLISVRDLAVLSTEFSACYSVNTWVGNFASETRVYATPITSPGKSLTTLVFRCIPAKLSSRSMICTSICWLMPERLSTGEHILELSGETRSPVKCCEINAAPAPLILVWLR